MRLGEEVRVRRVYRRGERQGDSKGVSVWNASGRKNASRHGGEGQMRTGWEFEKEVWFMLSSTYLLVLESTNHHSSWGRAPQTSYSWLSCEMEDWLFILLVYGARSLHRNSKWMCCDGSVLFTGVVALFLKIMTRKQDIRWRTQWLR